MAEAQDALNKGGNTPLLSARKGRMLKKAGEMPEQQAWITSQPEKHYHLTNLR
jgi:hypothetical protein